MNHRTLLWSWGDSLSSFSARCKYQLTACSRELLKVGEIDTKWFASPSFHCILLITGSSFVDILKILALPSEYSNIAWKYYSKISSEKFCAGCTAVYSWSHINCLQNHTMCIRYLPHFMLYLGLSLICLQVCLFSFPAFLLKCSKIACKCVYFSHIMLNKTNFYPNTPQQTQQRNSQMFITSPIIVLQHNRSSQVVLKAAALLSIKCGIWWRENIFDIGHDGWTSNTFWAACTCPTTKMTCNTFSPQ